MSTPVTTEVIAELAPGLLQNSIDQRIVKVRPMSTPIDQLSRCAGSRKADAMKVEYYSVDTKSTETTFLRAQGGGGVRRSEEMFVYRIYTADDTIFEATETLLLPAVKGGDGNPLVLYVAGRSAEGGLDVSPVNGVYDEMEEVYTLPDIAVGSKIIRMGRAATELDVQTAQFTSLPKKSNNNCQIFKMQVEQSTLAKIARKEVGWNFSDQEEAAIIDMRLGMEKNFLFGKRHCLFDSTKNENIYFTGGIWNQTDEEMEVKLTTLNESTLISLCAKAFTGNNGSKRKILIAGTALMEALSKITFTKMLSSGETMVKWGVEFKEICSNFGSLYVLHSEVFDQCGHKRDGFILDPEYMTKYVHVPFQAEKLDLRKSGQRNTDAVVLTEASCLVLRYPKSHLKVIGI